VLADTALNIGALPAIITAITITLDNVNPRVHYNRRLGAMLAELSDQVLQDQT
jgi:hypothetical protein